MESKTKVIKIPRQGAPVWKYFMYVLMGTERISRSSSAVKMPSPPDEGSALVSLSSSSSGSTSGEIFTSAPTPFSSSLYYDERLVRFPFLRLLRHSEGISFDE